MGISFGVVQDFQNAGVRKVYKANQLKSDNNAVSTDAKTCAAELRCSLLSNQCVSDLGGKK